MSFQHICLGAESGLMIICESAIQGGEFGWNCVGFGNYRNVMNLWDEFRVRLGGRARLAGPKFVCWYRCHTGVFGFVH